MKSVITLTSACVAADADGLATAAVCTGAGPWLPNIATVMPDGLAHFVTITQAGATNHSAKTATITGAGPDGETQTEAISLPNGATTVTSTKYYTSVTSVALSASITTDTMTMGYAVNAVSRWQNVSDQARINTGWNLGIGCTVVAGSPNYSVQYTMDRVAAFTHSTLSGETTSQADTQSFPVDAIRLLFAAAGTVTMTGIQY